MPSLQKTLVAKLTEAEQLTGQIDLWAKYRETEWRLPTLGAPGPGDELPPTVPIQDLLQ